MADEETKDVWDRPTAHSLWGVWKNGMDVPSFYLDRDQAVEMVKRLSRQRSNEPVFLYQAEPVGAMIVTTEETQFGSSGDAQHDEESTV